MRNLASIAALALIAAACTDSADPAPTTTPAPVISTTTPATAASSTTLPPPATTVPPATTTSTSPPATAAPATTGTTAPPPPCADLNVPTEAAGSLDGALSLHNTTGDELWVVDLGNRFVTAFRLLEDVALVAFSDAALAAVAVADCSLLWTVDLASPAVELILHEGALLVVDGENVSAFQPTTGKKLWVEAWRSDTATLRHPAAAITDGVIALADSNRTTMARMFADGQLASDAAALGEGELTVVAGDGRFYAASDSGRITAFPAIGQRIWVTDLDMEGPVRISYDGGVLFAAGLGSVAALDAEDGSVRWQVAITTDGDPAEQQRQNPLLRGRKERVRQTCGRPDARSADPTANGPRLLSSG